MKTHIFISTFFIAALLVTTGCEKFLDAEPKTSLTVDLALSTPSGLQGSVIGLYNGLRSSYRSGAGYFRSIGDDLSAAGTNITDDGATIIGIQSYNFQLDANNSMVTSMWTSYYNYIKKANLIIDNADKVGFTDEKAKNRLIAEARWFRAYMYFFLVQKYDNIPLVSEYIETLVETAEPGKQEEVYSLIESDLEFASNNLDPSYPEPGRITKGAAQHALAKVKLVLKKWPEAAALADLVISGPYTLQPAEELFLTENKNNSEGIMVLQFTHDEPSGGGHNLAQVFVPLYDRANGVERTMELGGRPYGRVVPDDYLFSLYKEGDKRLTHWYRRTWEYNVDIPNDKIPAGKQIGDIVYPADQPGINPLYFHPTITKFFDNGSGTGRTSGDAAGWSNIQIYRLGETYLIAAEAYMRAGDMTTALKRINKLRERADIEDLTALDQNILLEENARELAFEGHRWFDLKRMGVLIERVKLHNPDASSNIQDFHVRWPIPQETVDLGKYPQNKDYL